MIMMSVRSKNIYVQTHPCPICGETAIAVTKPNLLTTGQHTFLENDSIMKILNLKSCEVSLMYCNRCIHYFNYPLFDEQLVYGEQQAKLRKELASKYFKESKNDNFNGGINEILKKNKNYLQNISTFFEFVDDNLDFGGGPIKVLDYGAGDARFITLLHHLNRAYDSPFVFYAFDYHMWVKPDEDIKFIENDLDILKKEGPYDLIICTNVLEHTAEPYKIIELFNDISHSNTHLYLEVPLQYHFKKIIRIKGRKAYFHYHQQTFSLFSLQRLLELNKWGIVKSREVLNDFYRGNREATIKVLALKDRERSLSVNRFHYKFVQLVNSIKLFSRIVIKHLWFL